MAEMFSRNKILFVLLFLTHKKRDGLGSSLCAFQGSNLSVVEIEQLHSSCHGEVVNLYTVLHSDVPFNHFDLSSFLKMRVDCIVNQAVHLVEY